MSVQNPLPASVKAPPDCTHAIGGHSQPGLLQNAGNSTFEIGAETIALLSLDTGAAPSAFFDRLHPDDKCLLPQAMDTLFRTSSPVVLHARLRLNHDDYVSVVLRLRYFGGVVSIRTTHVVRAGSLDVLTPIADATFEREARLSLASYATRDTVWEWNIASGEYRFSRRFAEMLGHVKPIHRLDMKAFSELLHPDDVTAEERARRKHLAEYARYDIDYRLRDASGGYRWFRAVAETYRDESGRALSMAGTISDIDAMKFAEGELLEQRNEMARLSREVKDMSLRLINSQESERRHIARELHDQTGQTLTSAVLDLEFWRGKGVPVDEVEHVLDSVKRALSEIRDISLQLRPPLLDESGLENALSAYLDRQAVTGKFDVTFSTEGQNRRLPPQIEITAFRLVQEAVTNIVRHAQARFVDVSLKISSSDLVIRISDDGSGCVAVEALSSAIGGTSLGLISMNERALLVGGRCEFISTPGVGSIVLARIPLD